MAVGSCRETQCCDTVSKDKVLCRERPLQLSIFARATQCVMGEFVRLDIVKTSWMAYLQVR